MSATKTHAPPPPPVHDNEANTLTATVKMTEEFMLQHQLSAPRLKAGDVSYSESKQGSVAYDPECVQVVSVEDFATRHSGYKGSNLVVSNCLPPVDWQNPLFSEDDNRADLTNKVYLPLSRVLHQHGLSFGQDSMHKQFAGAQDSVVIDKTTTVPVAVVEEKSEVLMTTYFPDEEQDFPSLCKTGRDLFIQGRDQRKESPAFGCPLILAQLLGYMKKEQVTHGIIITSGRAHYVWIEVPVLDDDSNIDGDNEPKKKKAKPNSNTNMEHSELPAIMVTQAVMITHPHFLRMMASFLRDGQKSYIDNGIRSSTLLSVPSGGGGFTKGKAQDISKSSRSKNSTAGGTPSSNRGTPTTRFSFGSAASLISVFTKMPPLQYKSVLASSLGRDREGRVIAVDWFGNQSALKMAELETVTAAVRQRTIATFQSEFEAYEIAGRAGLWGIAVPKPLFYVKGDTLLALCTEEGSPMPSDPNDWSKECLTQAFESVQMLHNVNISLTDIKPANFVRIPIGDGNRVVSIDLECFAADCNELELPDWLQTASRTPFVSP